MFSDRDPNSFTNLRENDIVVPGGHLDNSSSVIYDDDLFDDGQNTARIDLQQQHQHALETIRQLRQRLVRRTNTIEEIRRYYLRDIVTMKLVIREVLSESDRERVWQQYDDILPSLDLKDSMRVHAPHGYEFTIKPCEMCGGQLELVKKDTDQVEALRKALRDSKERENRWREKLAVLDAQVETVAKERAETTKSHMEEKRVLYEELKKVNEIIGRLKDDREKIIGSNKKLKEENETVKQRNSELEAFPARLKDAERDNEILKGNLQTMQEQLKISRAHEKALQKDLLEAQDRVKDLEGEIETVQQELVFAKQECKQAELAVSRVRDMSSDLEHSLEVVNREKLELNKRISELEEEALAMQESQSKTIREYERAIDQLRHDLREAQKTHKFSSKEQEKVVRELEICKETIAQLTELNKNQELELLDNAEEIQLFEQEIVAMQQFIREKVALRTFTIDADAPTAGQATELPDILKVIEGVLGDDDDEPEPDDIHPSEMELKREVSALSADDNDSVGSAGATKVLKNRHKALKSKRTVRQVNKAATEKKNQLLLKQASERLKPIDFSEISDDSGGEDNGDGGGKDASKPDANTDTTTGGDDDNEDGGAGSDEEATDKKKGTGKSPKKKKSGSTSSGGGGKKGNKSGTTRRSMQGSTPSNSSSSKKKSSDGHESADSTKPKKGSGKPSTPSEASKQASRAGSAGGSDVEDVRSSNGTPNRSALSSAEGKRPVSSTNRGAEAPKVHGRHHKKRMTSIKSSQVGELLEKAAQVAQEAVDLDEDPDKTDEHGDGSGKKPSEMTLGSDDEGEDEFITDGDDAAVHVTSSKKTGGSAKKTAPVKSRHKIPMNPTIPEESDAFSVEEGDMAPYGQVIVRSDMPVIEAAVAVAAASEVLSEIGIKPPSVASVLEDMLLTENQPKEVFHGVPNAKVEMKRSESVRRRKSIPKDFNFNVHSFEEHPPAPLEPLHLHIPPPKVLTIDTTTMETTSASSTDAPTADGGAAAVVAADGDGTVGPTVVDPSAQTTPSMLREARQMAETHARQHKQTRDLIDSTKDRLRQLRSLFDAPQNVLHPPARSSKKNKNHRTTRSPGKESGDEEGDDADDDGEANAKSSDGAGLVIPRGPKIKGEEVTKKPAAKKDDDKKPPAPSYIIEEKKPKEKKAAAPVKAAPVKPVTLAPPPPDATRLELSLRDQLLSVLHDATAAGSSTSSETVLYLNKNAIHCALNVMSPVLHQFSRMMEHAVHAMWDSLIVNRNSLDFYQKALVVFDGIVQCAAEDTTNVRVAEICAKLVPVAGATYNSHLTSAWQQACHIPASMVQDLTPFIVNYDTNERRSKTYEEFLHNAAAPSTQQQQQQPDAATDTATTVTGADDQSMVGGGDGTVASAAAAGDDHSVAVTATSAHLKTDDSSVVSMDTAVTTATVLSVLPLPVYEEKLVKALDTVQKMQEYGEQVKDRLNEDMVEVLREWSTSKTVHLELDERIELEKEKVRRAGEVKLAAVAKELAKVMAMNEKNQEKLREAEIKLKDIPMLTAENQRKQQALTEVKEKLETTETRLADRIKDFHDLQRVSTAQQNTIATLETNVQGLEQHISMVTTELTQEKAQKTTLDEYLRVRTAERDRLNEHLNTMVEQEHHRLHALHDVQIQYEPDNSDHQVQTEFLTAPLDIKTMLHHKQAQHAYAKFPMVYSAAIDTTTSKPGTAGMLMGSGSAGGGPRTGSSQFGGGGGGGGGATMHQFSLHASPSTTAGGGGALSTARTNRTGNTYTSSAGGGPLSSPHLGLERMNSTDSILQQFAGSDSFRVPPPIIHYDYDNRQHQEFIRQQQQAQEGGGSLLRQNQHSIGVGGDDGDMPGGGGGSLYFDPRFNDSYDGDALNLQTPPYRPSSSAEDTNATENPHEEAFPAAPLGHGGNYTHHPQPMSTASSVASSKKVQHHHLVVPHSGRSGYHSDAGVNATSTGTTGDHHHHDRYRELAAQALMNRAHVHYEADGPASSSSQKNPLLGPLSLTKPSSASSGPGGGRTRANSYFDLSSPTSPRGGQHSPPNGPVPPAKKGAAMQHAAAASSSSPTYAAPQSHNGFQHHVPSKINTRTQEIRDGIVYQKRAGGGGVGGGSNGGPGKSGIGLFKGMSTSTGGAVTPAQLQELTIDMTKAAQQQKNNSNSLPPLTMLGNGSMTLEGGPSMTSVKSHKSRAYQGPYKLDDASHAPAIQMSKSTTSLGQAGLAALQSADTLKKLQKEFF